MRKTAAPRDLPASAPLPTGTVTLLFTDLEGSTRLWEQYPDAMRLALARHDALVRAAIEGHRGHVFKTMGDEFCAAFAETADALAAALAVQESLRSLQPAALLPGVQFSLRARVALHTGVVETRENDYFGPALNRIHRLKEVGHGSQVLLSEATAHLAQDCLPSGASLRGLGSHRLRDLQRPERIFRLLHPDLPGDFAPLRSLDRLPNNLPQQVTRFVGREQAILEVKRLLAAGRLLTLTGAGGTGKTRLSLQVAADLLADYPDGVWLFELAELAEPERLPQALARVLGVRDTGYDPITEILVEELKPQRLLLILDNCERLLPAASHLADALLRAYPQVRILASSRERLDIPGEQIYQVLPLEAPDPRRLQRATDEAGLVAVLSRSEAVQLFVDRARLAQPDFALTPQNAAAVARVCHRLEGIPLLIELAAARLRVVSLEQVVRRLDDLFSLLSRGSRILPPRQQTVRALIDWSHDLLSEPEQRLFRRLAVFAGGFTLEAAEGVCAGDGIDEEEVLPLLERLSDKSLVIVGEQEAAEARYRLLDTMREYAAEKLREAGEEGAVRGRHREWFLALMESVLPRLGNTEPMSDLPEPGPPEAAIWLQRLAKEYDNLLAAVGAVVAPGAPEEPSPAPERLAQWERIVEQLAPAFRQKDRRDAARAVLEDYIALCQACGYARGMARGYTLLGRFLFFNADWSNGQDASQAMFERAIVVCEAHGLHDWIVYPRSYLASALAGTGADLERAESLIDACLPQAQARQDTALLRSLYACLMWIATHRADWEALQAAFQASLEFGGPFEMLMLTYIEDICHRHGASATFTGLCRSMAAAYARTGLEVPIQRWYLEAASPRPLPGEPWLREEFEAEDWHPALQWQDATGRGRLDPAARPGWLGLYPPEGANLWPRADFNAPRLMATVHGDFIAQTRLELGADVNVLAGLLLWRDEAHFARLELQSRSLLFERALVHLEACVAGRYRLIGRGQCERQAGTHAVGGWLRMERWGNEVRGLCSADGEQWMECGSVHWPPGETEQVGLAAVWYGPESHVWFDHFYLWQGGE